MISTDFAPNEQLDDALLSLSLIFQPWKWKTGPETEKVKEEIKKLFSQNTKYLPAGRHGLILNTYFFLSGRSALYHLLKSFNLPKNSEVIVQAFTCEAVVLPIIANNFRPVYVDIEKQTLSMDLKDLKKKISPQTKVLILQHTFGQTPQYRKEIIDLVNKNNLLFIEDLAHGFSHNLFTNNQLLITNNYFLLSFGRSKPFSSVFGGAVVTFDKKNLPQPSQPSYSLIFKCLLYKPIAVLIKSTYNCYLGKLIHKIADRLHLLIREITDKEKMGKFDRFLDAAYPNAFAILLLNQLKKYDKTQKIRKKIVQYYNNQLSNIEHLSSNISLLRYPILINNRDQLINLARKDNIFLGQWYNQVVAPKYLDLDKVFYKKGSCPIAEEICKRIINLPTNISKKEAQQIVQIILNVKTQMSNP